jgi:hypothetical protein
MQTIKVEIKVIDPNAPKTNWPAKNKIETIEVDIPEGYRKVTHGYIKCGDLIWNWDCGKWVKLETSAGFFNKVKQHTVLRHVFAGVTEKKIAKVVDGMFMEIVDNDRLSEAFIDHTMNIFPHVTDTQMENAVDLSNIIHEEIFSEEIKKQVVAAIMKRIKA